MDLIDRAAAIDAIVSVTTYEDEKSIREACQSSFSRNNGWIGGVNDAIEMVNEVNAVEAVPLDKLCEWLSKHVGKIRCNDCWVACSDPCPGTADDWRRVITNWMEGLDDHR